MNMFSSQVDSTPKRSHKKRLLSQLQTGLGAAPLASANHLFATCSSTDKLPPELLFQISKPANGYVQ